MLPAGMNGWPIFIAAHVDVHGPKAPPEFGGGQDCHWPESLVNAQSEGVTQHVPGSIEGPQSMPGASKRAHVAANMPAQSLFPRQALAPVLHGRSVLAWIPYCWRRQSFQYVR
jgi:hypothetical protein